MKGFVSKGKGSGYDHSPFKSGKELELAERLPLRTNQRSRGDGRQLVVQVFFVKGTHGAALFLEAVELPV